MFVERLSNYPRLVATVTLLYFVPDTLVSTTGIKMEIINLSSKQSKFNEETTLHNNEMINLVWG